MTDTTGSYGLRAETIAKAVKGFALQKYKFKPLCFIKKSNSWKETYFQETAADLTAGGNVTIKGTPRLAAFPYGEVSWTETSTRNEKYAFEGVISWEDERTNDIDVLARTLLRIARGITKSVDAAIYTAITDGAGNTETIAAGFEWDSDTISNRDPIQNILNSKKLIAIDNYDIEENGYLLLNPTDYANILGNSNVRNAGQFYSADVTKNGRVGRLCGLTIIVSNNVADDEAIVMVGKEAVTWNEVSALKVETIVDAGIKKTIRAWEVGSVQVINPDAICKIANTQA